MYSKFESNADRFRHHLCFLHRFRHHIRFRHRFRHHRDALNPQNLEISPEFPDFPDFELRGPERSQKSGISCFLHWQSPEWAGIALNLAINTFFISIFVKVACLHYSVSRKAGPSSGVPIYWKVYKLIFNHAIYPNYNVRIPGKMTFVVFTRMAFHRAFHFSRRGRSWTP